MLAVPTGRYAHIVWSTTAILLTLMEAYNGLYPVDSETVTVSTMYGRLRGRRRRESYNIGKGAVTDTVDEFLGVRYARPPTGPLRFQASLPPESWSDVVTAMEYGSACPQDTVLPETADDLQDEDCLFLNIYSPYHHESETTLFPVMVFIHGGSYQLGTGNRYDAMPLAQHGVVVVTINYRLGAFGYLTTGDSQLSGNYGLLDQIQALNWVRDNIRQFRGDPKQVTIFGSSAGAASVTLLTMSPLSKGFFHRAIAQSGPATAFWATHHKSARELRADVRHIMRLFGCKRSGQFQENLKCLKKIPWREFYQKKSEFPPHPVIDPGFKPFVDGVVLPETPQQMLNESSFTKIPFMSGVVQKEFEFHFERDSSDNLVKPVDTFVKSLVNNDRVIIEMLKFEYRNLSLPSPQMYDKYDRGQLFSDMTMVAPTVMTMQKLSNHSAVPTYLYNFNHSNCYHSYELNFIFGSPFTNKPADDLVQGEMNFTEADKELSRKMMSLWKDFAYAKVPLKLTGSSGSAVDWKPFSLAKQEYLYISEHEIVMKAKLRDSKVRMWNTLLPRMVQQSISASKHLDTLCSCSSLWTCVTINTVLSVVIVLLLVFIFYSKRHKALYSQLLKGKRRSEPSTEDSTMNIM